MAAGAFIVIGSSRSGKSSALLYVRERLQELGFTTAGFDDKDYLMDEAIKDMVKSGFDLKQVKGQIETQKTVVENPEVALTKPRTLRLNFKDGRLLNDAHTKIMQDIGGALNDGDGRTVVLADLAYGMDVFSFGEGKVPLLQSGAQFVEWFSKHGILGRRDVLMREITAPFHVRAARNEGSEERISTDEFKLLFPDPAPDARGFFPSEREALGSMLRHIDNSSLPFEEYLQVIRDDFERNFLPLIDGEDTEPGLPYTARR